MTQQEKSAVKIPTGDAAINGNLTVPPNSTAIVVFAHGSGSSRFSPRNIYIAGLLNRQGFATLLIDLLTSEEEVVDELTSQFRFDIDLLAGRLADATEWLKTNPQTRHLSVGYFGASTGAAAALIAATKLPQYVKAVVSRGGRPDLAGEFLSKVEAPTLLIVGGNDPEVLGLNEAALRRLRVEKRLKVVSGATHLFEEPGKLQEAAELALDWFSKFL
jgi:dienelactone hydrolase